jgi:hypothetical protein
MGAWYYAPGG